MQDLCPINKASVNKQSLTTFIMIRKNSLFCKIFRTKTSSKFIFDSYMEHFRPELETCPICGTKGSCHVHDYYGRTLIDFHAGKRTTSMLCIQRVYCDSCEHAHAILPDVLIPYTRFGLIFILRVLAEHFNKLRTIEQICERYDISVNLLHKWITLWHSHKRQWLGILADAETSNESFLQCLVTLGSYSAYSMKFISQTSYSFLQCHKNPILKNPKNARYHQQVFLPDYFVS